MNSKKKPSTDDTIALNRRAHHDYAIEETFEAGLVLMGWELKSIRQGRVQLTESYVLLKDGEIWLIGGHITALQSASTHVITDPTRTRKVLLHRNQITKLIGAVERKGYTLIPLKLYWKNNRVKMAIGLAKGKKEFDKRASLKEKDWQREKNRVMKSKISRTS